MSKTLLSAAVGAILAIAAAMLNPSPEQHRQKIREVTSERSPLAGALGVGVLTAFASSYHSLGIASYTRVKDRTVSIGALGMVFVMSPSEGH